MKKTTVYLPDEVKASLERLAAVTGRSEADLIREAISSLPGLDAPARPRFPLFASGDPIAEKVDALLSEGFGLD
jgi:Ribbon-helix-helix protein, copG family